MGALKAKVTHLETQLAELHKDMKEVLKFVHETRGGKVYLFALLTVAATLGALVELAYKFLTR
jgi:biotin synthase-related radical SAM superfamily protein